VRVLVTGGHGFLGSHLVARLLADGVRVRCFARPDARTGALAGLPVEWVRGDLLLGDGLEEGLRDVGAVFHLAALTRSVTRAQMQRTNVGGTARLLGAACRAGFTGRLVFCSSLAAAGPSPTGEPLGEDAPLRPLGWYGESKRDAERLLRSRPWPFVVDVLRPTAVYGPRDRDFLALLRAADRGVALVVGRPDQRVSLVHAADVAEALWAAGRRSGSDGGTWFVSHPRLVTPAEVVAAAEGAVGRRARALRVPDAAARLLGRVVDLTSQLTGRASLLGSQRMADLLAAHWVCDPSRLARDLGVAARWDLEEGLRDAVDWYRRQGWMSAGRGRGGGRTV
jgi:nucleoside-diphosphate-sugar epimerase